MRHQHSARHENRAPLGLVVLAGGLIVWKSSILAKFLDSHSFLDSLWGVCLTDGPTYGLIALAGFLVGGIQNQLVRRSLAAVLVLVGLIALVDTVVLVFLGVRLQGEDVLAMSREWRLLPWVLRDSEWLIAFLLLTVPWYWVRLPRWGNLGLCTVALSGIGMVALPARPQDAIQRYSLDVGRFFSRPEHHSEYGTVQSIAAYREVSSRRSPLKVPSTNPHIIVVLVESLSLVDFSAFGGEQSLFPRFERIASSEGHVFTHFLTNYYNTNGALFSLLSGYAPLAAPMQSDADLLTYPVWNSVPSRLRDRGYRTEFLSTTPLPFALLGRIVSRLGISDSRGADEIASSPEVPRGAFDWPGDEVLFQEGSARVARLMNESAPFFLMMLTSTGHPPYTDPSGQSNTEEGVFSYVDKQLSTFYEDLKRAGFFENGILVVLGDHHKWKTQGESELRRMGEVGLYRVPLMLFGKGVRRGLVDSRLLSSADLLSHLFEAVESDRELVPYVVVIDKHRQDMPLAGVDRALKIVFKRDEDLVAYDAALSGADISWVSDKPVEGEDIEKKLHQFRAAVQGARSVKP